MVLLYGHYWVCLFYPFKTPEHATIGLTCCTGNVKINFELNVENIACKSNAPVAFEKNEIIGFDNFPRSILNEEKMKNIWEIKIILRTDPQTVR